MSLSQVLDAFTKNAVLYLVIVAVLAGLSIWMGLTTVGAFLVMVLGMMMILWDAHTDPHIPEACLSLPSPPSLPGRGAASGRPEAGLPAAPCTPWRHLSASVSRPGPLSPTEPQPATRPRRAGRRVAEAPHVTPSAGKSGGGCTL